MAFTRRSEATRAAILAAARQLLITKGYEAMTIRAVAAEAGIDPSMVMRYYGSKDGLFAAAVDVDLLLPDPLGWPREEVGARLADHIVARWEGALSDELIILLLRSVATKRVAVEAMNRMNHSQILKFVARVTGDEPDAGRRAALLASQVLGVALCRYVIQLPVMVGMDRNTLAASLAPVIQHYLFGDLSVTIRPSPSMPVPGAAHL